MFLARSADGRADLSQLSVREGQQGGERGLFVKRFAPRWALFCLAAFLLEPVWRRAAALS